MIGANSYKWIDIQNLSDTISIDSFLVVKPTRGTSYVVYADNGEVDVIETIGQSVSFFLLTDTTSTSPLSA